jgi:hypothetical protein
MTYLAGMWTSDVVNERIEGRLGTDQCLNTHRSADLTEQGQESCLMEGQCGNGRRESSAVEDAEVLLRLERQGRQVVGEQRLPRWHNSPGALLALEHLDVRVTDDSARDVRQWREIFQSAWVSHVPIRLDAWAPKLRTTRRRDAATEWYKWRDVVFEELGHPLDELPPHARVASCEGVDPDEHRASNPGFGHAGRRQRVQQGQNVRGLGRRWKDAALLVLEESATKRERRTCTRIR